MEIDDKKYSIKADFSYRLLSNAIGQGLGFIRTLIIPQILGPTLFGLWSILMIIVQYSSFAHLGTLFEMNRKLPYYEAKKDYIHFKKYRSMGFWIGFFITLTLSVVIIFYSLHNKPKELIIYFGIALGILLQHILKYQSTLMRSTMRFKHLSYQDVIFSFSLLALSIILGYYFDIYGVIAAFIFAQSIAIFLFFKINPIDRILFKFKDVKFIIKRSLMQMTIAFSGGFRRTVSQLVIASMLGMYLTGIYSFGVSISLIVLVIPTTLVSVFFPRDIKNFAFDNNKKVYHMRIFKHSEILAILSSILIGLIIICTDFGITFFLPKYVEGIITYKLIFSGIVFTSISLLLGNPFLVMHLDSFLTQVNVGVLALIAILSYSFIQLGLGLNFIAIGVIFVEFSYTTILYLKLNTVCTGKYLLFDTFKILSKPIIIVVISLIISCTVQVRELFWEEFFFTLIKCLVFFILTIPLYYGLIKQLKFSLNK